MICPIMPTPAYPHDHSPEQALRTISIDGKDYLSESRRTLPAGPHKLEFITTRLTKGHKFRQTRTIDIELKPCTIYYFYAKHPSKFSDEWELTLLRETEIKKCTK